MIGYTKWENDMETFLLIVIICMLLSLSNTRNNGSCMGQRPTTLKPMPPTKVTVRPPPPTPFITGSTCNTSRSVYMNRNIPINMNRNNNSGIVDIAAAAVIAETVYESISINDSSDCGSYD